MLVQRLIFAAGVLVTVMPYLGFPGSWKKKVIKNKLYRKYSVPVIAVTPAELKNLDAAILWELRREFGKGSV